jgi:aspartyl-tRNA(Asn)/glutamyl-tRNA(Gln) amidotransferase subunit A
VTPSVSVDWQDLAFASISTLARRLRRRELSALELARITCDQLEDTGRRYNGVAEVTRDLAEQQAAAADRLLAAGAGGPLCGIPFGVKDLVATAGIPTRWGSPVYRDQVFDYDATIVTRLRAAGAVLVAKVALVELAGAGRYGNAAASLNGPGLNPWDPTRWSGGSSSGPGVVVGAGLVPFAIGSETGASLVVPSAFCGVSGLRPSFGAVSRAGSLTLAWSTDRLGPMAHNARDCGTVLTAIAGRDPDDPSTEDWRYRGPAPSGPRRIGIVESDLSDHPATAAAFDEAIAVFRAAGHDLTPIRLPDGDIVSLYDRNSGPEIAAEHEALIRSDRLNLVIDEVQRTTLRSLLERDLLDHMRAAKERLAVTRATRDILATVNAVIAPTVNTEALPVDADLFQYRGPRRGGNHHLGALAGLPELSVPMGFGPAGLPLGLSLIGQRFSEPVLVRLAAEFQAHTDWHLRRPTLR